MKHIGLSIFLVLICFGCSTTMQTRGVPPQRRCQLLQWGTPAENGLQLGIGLSNDTLSSRQELIVQLGIRNTSDQTVATPFPKSFPWIGICIDAITDGGVKYSGVNVGNLCYMGSLDSTDFIILLPGQEFIGSIDVKNSLKGLWELQALEPGNYVISAKFDYQYAVTIGSKTRHEGNRIEIRTKPVFPAYQFITGESGQVPLCVTE